MHRIKVHCLILCMLSSFSCFSKKIFKEHQSIKRFGSRSGALTFLSKLIFFSTSSSILAKKRKHNALERSKFKVFTSDDDDDDMHRLKDYLYESMTECCST